MAIELRRYERRKKLIAGENKVQEGTLYTVISAGRAKPVSRPETDRLFGISDRVQVTILLK